MTAPLSRCRHCGEPIQKVGEHFGEVWWQHAREEMDMVHEPEPVGVGHDQV